MLFHPISLDKASRKGFIQMVSIKPFIPVIEAGFTTARACIRFGEAIGERYTYEGEAMTSYIHNKNESLFKLNFIK